MDVANLAKGHRVIFDGRLYLTIQHVFRAPRATMMGKPLPPFASVRWDDEPDMEEFINLATLEGSLYQYA